MKVGHIGIVCRREREAERFFTELLGMTKSDRKTIPAALARSVFGIDAELQVANYVGDGIHFEVFLRDDPPEIPESIAHVCLEIDDLDALLARARAMNVTVLRVPKGEGWVTFIEDHDGHRFEIKQAAVRGGADC
jgi:catechol 2,3-dioxygenase-like lactoylglutathione lyase family enzyme